MVTDVYSHILDENRRANAELFERAFYSGKGQQASIDQAARTPQDTNAETIIKLLNNPEAIALMKKLIAAVESQKD